MYKEKEHKPAGLLDGGVIEGLILLVLMWAKRNPAIEKAKATPNFNRIGFKSVFPLTVIFENPRFS